MSLRRLFSLGALIVAALHAPRSTLHAQADVIRGRITGPDSTPVERATITVTSLSGNVSRSSRTDKAGRYTITFPGGDGDYFVSIAAIGFASKRFEVKRTGDQEILIADAKLQTVAAQLDAVKVNAERQRVSRNLNGQPDISGTERPVNNNAVSADQLGDLAALAASMPGVQLIPGADGTANGFSVLGLSADQNATTLNGMNFGGTALPRDANVSSSLATSPYDVSRGNFSGGLLNVRSRPGSNYIIRSTSLNFDSPHLQWTDPAARSLGQQYQNVSLGGLVSGPIATDKAFYSMAYQAGRRTSDLQTLLNTDVLGLQTAGIAKDSVSRLLNILNGYRVPGSVGGVPGSREMDNALLFGTIDFTPPSASTGDAFNVTFNGSWNRQNPSGLGVTELPAHSGERTNYNGGIQARHSAYYGFGLLSETSVGFNQSRFWGDPYLALPSANVRVNSTFADGTPSVQNVAFGGNPAMNVSQTSRSLQAMNQLSWFSENNKHRLKLTTELRRDAAAQDLTTNELGSFSFNSLADLAAGTPASFARTLSPRTRDVSEYIGGVSLGDSYRPADDLQFQYGLRLDGNRFASSPALNSAVEQTLGVANDHVPNNYYLSPRVGFSYTYGTASQVGGFFGAARSPRAVIRGGVGIFQGTPNVQSIASVLDNNGLPSGVQQLACVGIATPIPDWSSYETSLANIPTQCADGTVGSVFANAAPNVTLFDKNFRAPRSLRSNLQWTGALVDNRFNALVDATYSRNMNQASTFDLNFNPVQQFVLSNEDGRPVYAQPTSIVAGTGAIAAGEGRATPLYSHVSELRSDMQSETRQLTLQLSPASFSSSYSWSLAYVYSNARERYRGFSSTGGNPVDAAWGRSSLDSRHQIVYNLTYNAFDLLRLSWYGTFRSGLPYTPLVTSDVNGDGYANDRAYIFDPSKATDPVLANGMRSLLGSGSASARDCLASQLGQIAQRNSCQGPWSTTANLGFSFNPLKVRMPQRTTLSFQISNPLGAADYLMHGESRLHGWGQTFIPTSNLLYVRGFDPATRQYQYEVNQRFGATALAQNAIRSPVTLTALLRVDVGPTRERQDLTQTLDRGRATQGTKMPENMMKAMYGSGGLMNPMAQILRQSDTLELTQQQADSIAILNRWYTIKLDSIWSPVVKALAALPTKYDQGEAYERYRSARQASVDALMRVAPPIKSLLTAEQLRRLPTFVAPYLDQRYLASVRSGTSGTGLGMIMLPGGMAMPAGVGGGGGQQIIIRSGTP